MRLLVALSMVVGLLSVASSEAAGPAAIREAVEAQYTPAEWHRGLDDAQEHIDPDKLRAYVTVVEGGIPAAKAEWYVTNQNYEYRPVLVNVTKGTFSTRRGKTYAYLDRGLVMVVAAIEYSGSSIYLKLLSADLYKPLAEKHPSRIGVLLGFKFSKEQLNAGNSAAVISEMQKWVRPFRDYRGAADFSTQLIRTPSAH